MSLKAEPEYLLYRYTKPNSCMFSSCKEYFMGMKSELKHHHYKLIKNRLHQNNESTQ